MKYLINEDFKSFELSELPYDHGHTALGEYHHIEYKGNFGPYYDPIPLHQWRSLDGSWLITEEDGIHYLEQNRGDNTKGVFEVVYPTLVHKQIFYVPYNLEFDIRLFEINRFSGMAFNYKTSRKYNAVFLSMKGIFLAERKDDDINIISSYKIDISPDDTYKIRVELDKSCKIYLNNKLLISSDKVSFISGRRCAFVSKSCARYSFFKVSCKDEDYFNQIKEKNREEIRLDTVKSQYSPLKLIKKIDLLNFGTGRQIRFGHVNGKTVIALAQHQKRYIRDSFAHISSITVIDLDGNALFTIGEPCNSLDNSLISCDLPFQIADIDNDGEDELIYARNFELRIVSLKDGKLKKKMKTPVIYGDNLVKNEPFYRLNVDAIRVADFEGLGYQGDFIIKDRYQNVYAYNKDMKLLWRYHNKNTGHFPYIYDFNNDGKDEMFVGYDYVSSNGEIISSLPMNSDHTDEIIYCKLKKDYPYQLILASGNEGMNIVNLKGEVLKHNNIGHAQRISVAKYRNDIRGLQICATSFWGSDGIVSLFDCDGNLICEREMGTNGTVITPVLYDGENFLILSHADKNGGLLDGNLECAVSFPDDGHPTLCTDAYDIDDDGIDEILCWDNKKMYIYKAKNYKIPAKKYKRYPSNAMSNYRGEYIIEEE